MELLSDVDAYHWVRAADGQIPDGAVPHGWDTDGAGVGPDDAPQQAQFLIMAV